MPTPVEVDGENIKEIKDKFNEFWNRLWNKTSSPIDQESLSGVEPKIIQDSDNSLKIKIDSDTEGEYNALWIKDLPESPKKPNKHIDVRIQFEQRIEAFREESGEIIYEITSSKVRVQYIRGNRGEAKVIGGYHFDYDKNQDPNHPIFHAQFEPMCIRDGVFPREYEIDHSEEWNELPEFPRVPCAPIELAGVVYLILKDHNPKVINESDGEYNWPSGVEKTVEALPGFSQESFRHLSSGEKLIADHWYAHDDEDEEGNLARDLVDR